MKGISELAKLASAGFTLYIALKYGIGAAVVSFFSTACAFVSFGIQLHLNMEENKDDEEDVQ